MEINYSKKQINPLISKFAINPETNNVFKSIIALFNDQTNYQVWAIKMVFDNIATLDEIIEIQKWAENNQTEIKNLIKGNIVSYKNKSDFARLKNEIVGLGNIKFVNDWINSFNTDQKKILRDVIMKNVTNGDIGANDNRFLRFHKLFKSVSTLPKHRIEKLISTSSALRDFGQLIAHIDNALKESYTWDKTDMLGYMARNCQDCELVYEKDNIVVVEVKSFNSSQKLCGGGRTGWCLTRQESYFNNYTRDNDNAKQFFIFDFSKREDHELAHVGVSVNPKRGITHAHTTRNNNLMGTLNIDNEKLNIYGALDKMGISKNIFIRFGKNNNFLWNVDAFLEWADKNKTNVSISLAKDNRIIVMCNSKSGLKNLMSHTYLNIDNISFSSNNKVYVMLDFNVEENYDNSFVVITYNKDKYGIDTMQSVYNGFNTNITRDNYLSKIGIETDMYLNRENVDPKILLHKYIEEMNERAAIELLNKHADLDVNFEFNNKRPIYSVIENGMANLFNKMISIASLDCNVEDTFCEKLIHSLLYSYLAAVTYDKNKVGMYESMIVSIINSKAIDINVTDFSDDTALHVCCQNPELLWAMNLLLENKDINVNIVNDFNCTPLGSAILKNNIKAIEILAQRNDVVVREEDYELAANKNINLDKYFSKDRKNPFTIEVSEEKKSFAELFAKALGI